MARKKNSVGLTFTGFSDLLKSFEDAGGEMEKAVKNALAEVQHEVAENARKAVRKENLPAKGEYSQGESAKRIIDDGVVEQSGTRFEVSTGFELEKDGKLYLVPLYLIYGTPKQDPVDGLKNAVMGRKVEKHFSEALEQAMNEVVKKVK